MDLRRTAYKRYKQAGGGAAKGHGVHACCRGGGGRDQRGPGRSRRADPQELRRQPRPRRHRLRGGHGRDARRHRPERQRQEHAPPHDQPAGADPERADLLRRRGDHEARRQGRPGPAADRHRLPAVQPLPAPARDGQPDPRGAPREEGPAQARPRSGLATCSPASASPRRSGRIPTSCRAASSSGSRSPGRWSWSRT